MTMKFKSLLSILLLILIPLVSISQNIQKPKIGLVLSGGGAKGIAHLGMLHALDSLNIKPDYITGTSMGSIVGALYAIGYSAKEMDDIISEGDWDYILSDDIPLNDIETSKKHNYKRHLLTFNFSDNLMPKLPAGIVYGQHISEYFSELTWRVADIKDFNNFEIPYKCVSSDLISGKPYFFDSGDLSTAMRSSMSIPTIFSPMKIDTLLLVDGGVYRNFPVIDVIEMGAEKIIGSYTGFKQTATFEEMQTLTSVLVRSSTFAGIQDILYQEELCDYYIKYDLHELGPQDFKEGEQIIEYGIESMNNSPVLDSLVALSHLLEKYPEVVKKSIPERDSITIGGMRTEGLSMVSNNYIFSKSGLEIGDKISKDDMGVALNNMMGTLLFNKITYKLIKTPIAEDKDSFIIEFDIVEKARGQMQVSLNYDNFFGPSLYTGFLVRNFLLTGSETKLRLNWSENPMAHFDYDVFFGKNKRMQASTGVKYEVLNVKTYFDFGEEFGNLNLGSQTNTFSEFYGKIAYNFNTNNQLGIKYEYQISTVKYKDGAEIAGEISDGSEYGHTVDLYFNHNNYNKQFYATKGSFLYFSAKYGTSFNRHITGLVIDDNTGSQSSDFRILNMNDFVQFELNYKHLIEIGSKVSIQPSIGIGASSEEPSVINRFSVGGYSRLKRINSINMIGSNPYSFSAQDYAMANFDIQFEVLNKVYLTLLTNTTLVFTQDVFGELIEEDYYSAGLTIGYLSPFGPIDAGFSINENLNNYWHVNIGFPF